MSSSCSDCEDLDETVVADLKPPCYTPPDLQNIFSNACNRVLQNDDQCKSAWEAFSCAFGFKDPNTITANNYDAFFRIIPVDSQPNTVLFWTGVSKVIDQVSMEPDISSSANQKASRIFNIMKNEYNVKCWCGSETSMIDTVTACPDPPRRRFWAKFSVLLAESTTGVAFWVGYGNNKDGAYKPISYFAMFEFPNMTPDRVKRFVVIDIYHDNGEQCRQGSLLDLRNQAVEKYGSNGYICYMTTGNPDDPNQVNTLANAILHIIRKEQNPDWYVCTT